MKFILLTCALLATPFVQATSSSEREAQDPIRAEKYFEGFVAVKKDREVYVRWTKAQAGQPTAILLNGLTYSTRQWEDFAEVLAAQGFGVLRYDMFGMGETLLKHAPILSVISHRDQVSDLNLLTRKLGLTGRLNLVGLSYGGGIALAYGAAYPNDVKNIIVMAPFTRPLAEQDEWIKSQIWYTRRVQPFNPASDDELYDFYLRQVIYTTYPSVEPVVLENPFKLEGVFRMVQGIRKWTSDEAVGLLPKASVHLMIAGNDQYIKRKVMEDFWASVPKERRASMIVVNNSEHKMPESVPFFSATWVGEILKKNPVLSSGREFDADPFAGSVRYEGGNLTFPREREGRGTIGRN
ncbi:MAG: alpha/beta fold hydrolase [Bdellovibrionaceae bacterium]|nr:alpha/beta fold hydrolase [Pseudobdellovibrionaceae bacterium]